ncbi:hypothetical protein SEA_FEDE_24 [Microbacterium phage Fede]|nr:hypothetical protein SEA_FEDE_24 [Microbacterium phage Fede]
MAPKKDTNTAAQTEAEISEAAAATRAEIGNRPRQSQVRLVQHYVTIRDTSPEDVERLFGSQADALEAVADKVENPVQKAIETATAAQKERSIKAMENDDALNGYANFLFNQEVFDEKTRVKAPRKVRTFEEKSAELVTEASDEDLAALAEMLKARGLV